jgi:Xaa-Pro aminopeptidase
VLPATPPFDGDRLDALLKDRGLDALIATSAHNVRYLTGGHSYFMYAIADSIGLSRYLPAVGYRGGERDSWMYVGAGNETWATDVHPLWIADVRLVSWGGQQTAEEVVHWWQAAGPTAARVGIEPDYLPASAYEVMRSAGMDLVDATELLEELRAVKRASELEIVRRSAEAVVESMLACFASTRPGDSKDDLFARLRDEETKRGLCFCYALISAGTDLNRGPSGQAISEGDVISLDSGATSDGWVADVTRMAVLGAPTARHEELLEQVARVQAAATSRAVEGNLGREVFAAAAEAIAECEDGRAMSFLAHGTGLVTHEAPRLTATGSPPYRAAHAYRPLKAGMVLSVESQVLDDVIGFVKLEDTVIVSDGAPELVAARGRGWNQIEV